MSRDLPFPAVDVVHDSDAGSDLRPSSCVRRTGVQLAHRSLALGIILLVGGVGAAVAGKSGAPLLLWAFGAGDVALLCAFVSLAGDRRRGLPGREPRDASVAATGVALAALVLYFVFRAKGTV